MPAVMFCPYTCEGLPHFHYEAREYRQRATTMLGPPAVVVVVEYAAAAVPNPFRDKHPMAKSKSSAATLTAAPEAFEGPTTPTGARNLYIVLLGRQADSPARVAELAAQPFSRAVRDMVQSAEFGETLALLSATGTLPERDLVPFKDMERAEAWLADIATSLESRAVPTWAGFLHDVLSSTVFTEFLPEEADLDGALAGLETLLEAADDRDGAIDAFVKFDPAPFANMPGGRALSEGDGTVNPSMPIPRKGYLPQVLPLFTSGIGILDGRDRPATVGELVRATQIAARKGVLGHWLFDENFYKRALAESTTVEIDPKHDAMAPYLQFLVFGDPADVAPHVLFSPFAYRQLNPDAATIKDGCFRHYVTTGAKQELRTSALFDPDFYLARHPHIRQEIATGRYVSALEHFVREGMAAGYAFSPDFDRHYYLATSPDVAEALNAGHIPSAEWHYVLSGAREGRTPNPYFNPGYYLQRYPSVGEEMARHGISNSLEHFLLLGRARGWRVNHPPVQREVELDQAKALFEKRGRRAYAEALTGVFKFPSTPAAPKLSVIVPISGQADFTAGFLKCARWAADHLEHKRGVTTEIIIVDNGSKDHTETLLAALPGVRVVRYDRPIGFPAAVNAGANVARGDILLIANNDIEFQADAFLRIVDGLDNHPEIGVLGAKIILPNETLQEVGSVLDKNAGAHGFGRWLDATECFGARMIDVDYASGCFIALSQADFETLSGLNEAYSPGYYEEVDLSLRMKAQLGKSTVVDTGLAITHYEHASFAKGRPQTVNEPLILRNRARLKASHADVFSALRSQDPLAAVGMAQKALSGSGRFLVVEDMMPSALLGSGFGREEEILDIFSRHGIAYDIVVLSPNARVDEYKNPLVNVYRAWMPGQSLEEVLARHGAKYSHLWLCRTHNLPRANAAIKDAKVRYGLKVVCDTEALSSMRVMEQLRVQGRNPDRSELVALATTELTDNIGVDLWIAVNRRERELMEALGVGPVREIGHSVTLPTAVDTQVAFEDRKRMLFIGAVHELTSPNYDGLVWFLTCVYPKLAVDDRPRLTVAGHWAQGLREVFESRFAHLDVDFVGAVTSRGLATLYSESRLAIAPTRFAGGIPCKVIESVLAGVPIVMTDLLAEQLDVGGDPDISAAARFDDGAEFARWVDSLWTNESSWIAQREAQSDRIGEASSMSRLREEVEAVLGVLDITLPTDAAKA